MRREMNGSFFSGHLCREIFNFFRDSLSGRSSLQTLSSLGVKKSSNKTFMLGSLFEFKHARIFSTWPFSQILDKVEKFSSIVHGFGRALILLSAVECPFEPGLLQLCHNYGFEFDGLNKESIFFALASKISRDIFWYKVDFRAIWMCSI